MKKNIILFLGSAYNSNLDDVKNFEISQKRKFRTAVLTSHEINLNEKPPKQEGMEKRFDFVLRCDTKNIKDIKKTIAPIKDEIVLVFNYFESWMPLYTRLVKLLPEVNMPSEKSLKICNSKLEMRKKFIEKYPEITPKFMLVNSLKEAGNISKEIGFPCITKPLNLTKSRLVIKSDNIDDLKKNLKQTFQKIKEVYKNVHSESTPQVLAEEFMEGNLYSIDAYINSKGKIYFTPIVKVITGKDIGVDDFFNYYRALPAGISENEEKRAQIVAKKALKATVPTAITVHIELMRTEKGKWKIVELQTRPGGYRNEMLKLSYGIKHYENDFLNKLGKKPNIPTKIKSYTAVLEIFPEKEGRIVSIEGIEEMKKMKSFLRYEQAKNIGDMCGFSRDGYTYVLQVVLNHKDGKIFEGDLEKIRNIIKIIIK
ncbi:MAG: ATP-grasp domain-containing protein [Patescibacteria group bacterium]|nr:ATP-grasp domain-containing protein [Patescibacteria group bacterium]